MPRTADVPMPLRASLAAQVGVLQREGSTLYDVSRHGQAARAWEHAALTAEVAGRAADAAEARFWQGVALHGMGRLREALVALGAVGTGPNAGVASSRIRHMALSRAVLVGVDLPVARRTIEAAITDVENVELHTGTGRTARLLLVRARLAQCAGEPGQAVQLAGEGLARAVREDAGFATGAYLKELLRGCLRCGDLEEAGRRLEEWERVRDNYGVSRGIFIAAFRSMLDRRHGRIGEAIASGARAVELAQGVDELSERLLSSEALVRALLCSDRPQDARPVLARVLQFRNSEPGPVRFEVRLLLGDFHLAMARRSAGLAANDVETGMTFGAGAGASDLMRVHRHVRSAERSWRSAGRVGERIDRLLDGAAHATLIAARMTAGADVRRLTASSSRPHAAGGFDVRHQTGVMA